MMADLDVLLEAERRGILPPEKKIVLDEARRRGIVQAYAPIPEVQTAGLPEQKRSPLERADDLARAVASGATFGGADEFAAGMAALTGTGGQVEGDYETLLAGERERQAQIPPSTAIPGEVGGGIAATAIAGPYAAGTKAAQYLARAPGWIKASGLGGLFGALYGFGSGEGGLEERLEGATESAALGGAVGAAGYPIAQGMSRAGSAIWDALRKRYGSARGSAISKFLQASLRDDLNLPRMGQRLESLGPQATLADVGGKNIGGLARHTANVPGPAQNRATIVLNQRAEGEAVRLARSIRRGLDPEDYYAAQDAFLRNMREKAGPAYQKAYAAHPSVTSPGLVRILEGQTGKRAVAEAVRLNKMDLERGADVINLEQAIKGKSIPLEAWDDIKRGFDALSEKPLYQNAKTGGYTKAGRGILKLKTQLLSDLDEATGGAVGPYAEARRIYAGEAEALGALRDGRKIFSMDPERITRTMGGLSEAGREAYRSGAARAMKDIIAKTPDKGSAASRLAGTAQKRAQIRAVFPDVRSFRQLQQSLIAEQRFAQTRGKILTGSMTEPRRAESVDALTRAGEIGGVMAGTQAGRLLGAHTLMTAGMGRKIGNALMGKTKAHDLEMAKILFTRDPEANRRMLDALMKKSVWQSLPGTIKGEIGRALLLGAVQQDEGTTEVAREGVEFLFGEE
jgi:hypothetical protein